MVFFLRQHQYHTKIDELIERTSSTMSQGIRENICRDVGEYNAIGKWFPGWFQTGVVSRLLSVLESVIGKLARYDEGSILGSILSFTVILFLFAALLFSLSLQFLALDAVLYLLCNFLLAPLGTTLACLGTLRPLIYFHLCSFYYDQASSTGFFFYLLIFF